MKTRQAARSLLLLLCLVLPGFGCHSLRLFPPPADRAIKPEKDGGLTAPAKYTLRVSQFAFLSDFELKRDLPIFRELTDLQTEVYRELQLPSSNSVVQVYLFEDRDRYERFMHAHYPDLPRRRAFFVAQPRTVGGPEELSVYTYWGERVGEDLRHELTHAMLHSVLKDVPLWLDEGLAEYFELPPDSKGLNARHLEQLRSGPGQPSLTRLEQLTEVSQMTPLEYREAWAWVHLMLHERPEAKQVLLAYLQQLRTNPNPGPLQPRLAGVFPNPEEALERHLVQLDAALKERNPEIQRTQRKSPL
jgi:hypothetical protein